MAVRHHPPRPHAAESLEPRRLLAGVSGTVFNDVDGDGQDGRDDPPAAVRTVYVDLDDDAVHDAADPTTNTNALGQFTINSTSIRGRTAYTVRLLPAAGWRQTAPTFVR